MPSPFPGMDPYLEDPALWPGVHQGLITYSRDVLQPQVRPEYHARIGERVYVVGTPLRNIYPDVTLLRRPPLERVPVAPGGAALLEPAVDEADEPYEIMLPPVEHREPFIEIIHTAGGEVVTVIEVLSPSNKTIGEGHDLYLEKQREVLDSRAHLVEIDLLGQGLHTVAAPLAGLADLPPWRYLVCLGRAGRPRRMQAYPIPLSRRLPRIRVPLREPDPDVVLDLQAIFNLCYDNGGYDDFVNYRRPPTTALSAHEQSWLQSHLQGLGIA
ncbi:MAG: DUF4058 family protein [Chloroflexota bacterium]